jgi:hypothetical protein
MTDEVEMLALGPGSDPALRRFLLAQLEWERYQSSRLRLIHMLAFGGLCLWLLLAMGARLPDPLHVLVLSAWGVCFLATCFAATMERRWRRRRLDCLSALDRKAGSAP